MSHHADWAELQELFSKYLAGSPEATGTLFGELLRVLTGFFHVRLNSNDDRDELIQATLLKIHFAREKFDPRQSLKTWVFTIASRSLIDHWRGMAAEGHLRQDDLAAGEGDSVPSDILDPAQKTQLYRDLSLALNKLKPIDRTIVYLYGVEEMSMKEIAQILSITETAAKLRAHRAYRELRVILTSVVIFFFIWLEK